MKDIIFEQINTICEFIKRYDFHAKKTTLQLELIRLEYEIQKCSHKTTNYISYNRIEKELNQINFIIKEIDYIFELDDILKDSDIQQIDLEQILRDLIKIKKYILDYLYNINNNITEYEGVIISLHAGAGGLEAEDWAGMLLRMYLFWCKRKNISTDIISIMHSMEVSNGIKSADIMVSDKMVYNLLKHETGIHRLVRKSPFSKTNSRHTSFCSVKIEPQIDDTIVIDLKDKDVKLEVTKGHGAGGQHRNKVETAVRLTHIETGITVFCQSERSQHRNKDNAYKILKSKLYAFEKNKQDLIKSDINKNLNSISWGNQVRSYVLHPEQRIKDHRSDYMEFDFNSVLDGNIDSFIFSSIKI